MPVRPCLALGCQDVDLPALQAVPVTRRSCCLAYVPTSLLDPDHVHLAHVAPEIIRRYPIISHKSHPFSSPLVSAGPADVHQHLPYRCLCGEETESNAGTDMGLPSLLPLLPTRPSQVPRYYRSLKQRCRWASICRLAGKPRLPLIGSPMTPFHPTKASGKCVGVQKRWKARNHNLEMEGCVHLDRLPPTW